MGFWILVVYYSGLYLIRQVFFTWTVQYLVGIPGTSNIIGVSGLIFFNFFGCVSVLFAGFITDKFEVFTKDIIMSLHCLLLSVCLGLLCFVCTSSVAGNVWVSILIISVCGYALVGPYSLPAGVISIKFGGKKSCATM